MLEVDERREVGDVVRLMTADVHLRRTVALLRPLIGDGFRSCDHHGMQFAVLAANCNCGLERTETRR